MEEASPLTLCIAEGPLFSDPNFHCCKKKKNKDMSANQVVEIVFIFHLFFDKLFSTLKMIFKLK